MDPEVPRSMSDLWNAALGRAKSQFLKMDPVIQEYFLTFRPELEAWTDRTKKAHLLCEVLIRRVVKTKIAEQELQEADCDFPDTKNDTLMQTIILPLFEKAKAEVLSSQDPEWLVSLCDARVIDDVFRILPLEEELRLTLFQSREQFEALNSVIEFCEAYRECSLCLKPKAVIERIESSWALLVEDLEPEIRSLIDSLPPEARSLLVLLDPMLGPVLNALHPDTESFLEANTTNVRSLLESMDAEEADRLFTCRDELRNWMETIETILNIRSNDTNDVVQIDPNVPASSSNHMHAGFRKNSEPSLDQKAAIPENNVTHEILENTEKPVYWRQDTPESSRVSNDDVGETLDSKVDVPQDQTKISNDNISSREEASLDTFRRDPAI